MGFAHFKPGTHYFTPHWQPDRRVNTQSFFNDHLEVRQLLRLLERDVLPCARAEAARIKLVVHTFRDAIRGEGVV